MVRNFKCKLSVTCFVSNNYFHKATALLTRNAGYNAIAEIYSSNAQGIFNTTKAQSRLKYRSNTPIIAHAAWIVALIAVTIKQETSVICVHCLFRLLRPLCMYTRMHTKCLWAPWHEWVEIFVRCRLKYLERENMSDPVVNKMSNILVIL